MNISQVFENLSKVKEVGRSSKIICMCTIELRRIKSTLMKSLLGIKWRDKKEEVIDYAHTNLYYATNMTRDFLR